MGRTAASIFVKYGYSIILIDSNMEKLQDVKLNLARTFVEQFEDNDQDEVKALDARIQLLQFDVSCW